MDAQHSKPQASNHRPLGLPQHQAWQGAGLGRGVHGALQRLPSCLHAQYTAAAKWSHARGSPLHTQIDIVDMWKDHTPWPFNKLPDSYAFLVRHSILWRISYQMTQVRMRKGE